MSWLQKLYATYEVGVLVPEFTNPPQTDGEKEAPALMPVSHTSQQAQIHVVLDGDGNFQRAELLPPKTQFVIPATEESAGRTSGSAPHPLADKIHYCAKDYRGGKKNCYSLYEALLKAWCDSPQSHPKARAVYAYLSRGRMVRDLLDCGILHADASGELLTQAPEALGDSLFSRLVAKKGLRDQGDALVVWSVVLPGDKEPRTWKDSELQQAWRDFDASQMQQRALCMVEGEQCAIAVNHPRKIRHAGDGTKIISTNDESGFTFRGRFLEGTQACTVGYETSHKAHNALRWLIARQGYRNGEQAVVAWAVNGARVPNPCEPIPVLTEADILLEEDAAPSLSETQEKEPPRDMDRAFAGRLSRAMRGYHADLSGSEGVAVLALDAAGPGRLSVTFYREQIPKHYLDNLESWQRYYSWPLPVQRQIEGQEGKAKPKTRTVFVPYAPIPETIARVAYGRRIDDKLLKSTIERLLPCIVDNTPLPRDLMESCVRRACNRVGLEKWEWPEVLGVACAVYKGYYARHPQKEEYYTMTLEPERRTRDYLFGRLLAAAEYVERTALDMAEEKRPTNAERLMQRFADHPASTWRQLEVQLSPYRQRLQSSPQKIGLLRRAQKTIREICDKFDTEEFNSPRKLSGEFLLGYNCQMTAFYTSSKNDNSADAPEQEGE